MLDVLTREASDRLQPIGAKVLSVRLPLHLHCTFTMLPFTI